MSYTSLFFFVTLSLFIVAFASDEQQTISFPLIAQQDHRGRLAGTGLDPRREWIVYIVDYNTSCSYRAATVADQFASIRVLQTVPKTQQYCSINGINFYVDPANQTWVFYQHFSGTYYSSLLSQGTVYNLSQPVSGSLDFKVDADNGRVVYNIMNSNSAVLYSSNFDGTKMYKILDIPEQVYYGAAWLLSIPASPYNIWVRTSSNKRFWFTSSLYNAQAVEVEAPGVTFFSIGPYQLSDGHYHAISQAFNRAENSQYFVAWDLNDPQPQLQVVCSGVNETLGAIFVVDNRYVVGTTSNIFNTPNANWSMQSCDLFSPSLPATAVTVGSGIGYSYILTIPPYIQRREGTTQFFLTLTDGSINEAPRAAYLWMVDIDPTKGNNAAVRAKFPVPTSQPNKNAYFATIVPLEANTILWRVQGGGLGYFLLIVDILSGQTQFIASGTNQIAPVFETIGSNRLIWGEYKNATDYNNLNVYDTSLTQGSISSKAVLQITGFTFWVSPHDGYIPAYSSTFKPKVTSTILALNTNTNPATPITVQKQDNYLNTYLWYDGKDKYSWVVSQNSGKYAIPSYIYSATFGSSDPPTLRAKAPSFNAWNVTFIPGCIVYLANNNPEFFNNDGWTFGTYGASMGTTCEVPVPSDNKEN